MPGSGNPSNGALHSSGPFGMVRTMKRVLFGMLFGSGALFWWQTVILSGDDTPSPSRGAAVGAVAGTVCEAATRAIDTETGSTNWRSDAAEMVGEVNGLIEMIGGKQVAGLIDELFVELDRAAAENPGNLDDKAAEIARRGKDEAAALAQGVKERC